MNPPSQDNTGPEATGDAQKIHADKASYEAVVTFKVMATGKPSPALSETGALPAGLRFEDNHGTPIEASGTKGLPMDLMLRGTRPNATLNLTGSSRRDSRRTPSSTPRATGSSMTRVSVESLLPP